MRSRGVLVHFSEDQTLEAPSAVPFIAMISCDSNGTQFSEIDDIFTLARDHGAQAALLYTVNAEVRRAHPGPVIPHAERAAPRTQPLTIDLSLASRRAA